MKLPPDFTLQLLMCLVHHACCCALQAAILAVGGTDKKVVLAKDGSFRESSVMLVTLSCDHRVVDGAVGAEWLQAFKRNIENPLAMLI
jgi:pyruvate dehydrogenase E2 component (dihydrolipoamide acetyltransferase)